MSKKLLTISEFSKLTKLSRKALLIYEDLGLLKPVHRTDNNYRKYSLDQKAVATEISELKNLSFSLEEIKRIFILKSGNQQSIFELLEKQKTKINTQIESQRKQVKDIESLMESRKQSSSLELNQTVVLDALSERIIQLNRDELIECTKNIESKDYITTVAMVNEEAREKLFSILSDEAKALVEEDLSSFLKGCERSWS